MNRLDRAMLRPLIERADRQQDAELAAEARRDARIALPTLAAIALAFIIFAGVTP